MQWFSLVRLRGIRGTPETPRLLLSRDEVMAVVLRPSGIEVLFHH